MGLDGVDDLGIFLVLAADVHTDLDMAALDLMVKSLADVMQQTGTACQRDVHTHLACQQAGQPGHFHAVGQSVLAKAGAVLQAADELDEVGVQAVDAQLHDSALALPLHLQLEVVAALLHRLLDAGGVDAAIADEALQRHAGHLAAGLVEGGQGNGLRGIIDDEVNAGGRLKGADVAALTADDAALHLVAGQRDDADGGLAAVVSSTAADGLADEVAGDAVAVLLQIGLVGGHADGLLVGQLLVHLVQQHFAGVLLAQAGQRFQTLHLLGAQGIDLGQMGLGLLVLLFQLFLALFQSLGLAVEGSFLLVDAVLLAADLRTALLDLFIGLCLLGIDLGFQAESLILCLQNGFLALLVGGLDRFVHQPGRLGLGAADLGLRGLFTVVVTNKIARSCGSDSNDQCHDHSDHGHCSSLSLTVKFCFNRQETLCGRTRARHQSNFQRKRSQQEQTQRKIFLCGRSGAAFRFTRCAYKNGQMKPH